MSYLTYVVDFAMLKFFFLFTLYASLQKKIDLEIYCVYFRVNYAYEQHCRKPYLVT
jgi:hypothetical protein